MKTLSKAFVLVAMGLFVIIRLSSCFDDSPDPQPEPPPPPPYQELKNNNDP